MATITEKEREYGLAWMSIIGGTDRSQGLRMMQILDTAGFIEGTIVAAMFCEDPGERKALLEKAADADNPEGLWQYSCLLPHSYLPNLNNAKDAVWESTCLRAAEYGSVDAMNEMGNVFHRRKHYSESMYWYAMARAYGHPDGLISMQGITREWKHNGSPKQFIKGSRTFSEERHRCAINYLEAFSGDIIMDGDITEIIDLLVDGEPLAAYYTGDFYTALHNDKMVFKIYNDFIAHTKDAHAMKICADMLLVGRGTAINQQRAYELYRAAARAGDRSAMYKAGEITENTDMSMAAYWYGLSHSRGYPKALQALKKIAESQINVPGTKMGPTSKEPSATIGRIITEAKEQVTDQIDEWDKTIQSDNNSPMTSSNEEFDITTSGELTKYKGSAKRAFVPEGTTKIGNKAFANVYEIEYVTIPEGVIVIDDYAFANCTGLLEIQLPDSLESIGDYAFSGCEVLKILTIPKHLKRIGKYAFAGCKGIQSIELPDSVTELGDSCFSLCESLRIVRLSSGINKLDHSALCACRNLQQVIIPEGTTKLEIGETEFLLCKPLTFYIPESLSSIEPEFALSSYYVGKLIVYSGSFGEKYAKAKGVNYEVRGSETRPNGQREIRY